MAMNDDQLQQVSLTYVRNKSKIVCRRRWEVARFGRESLLFLLPEQLPHEPDSLEQH